MSAVKNLRAMFEQKGDTSPPDRGRSPGIPPSIGSESPRPLSKVRTNFIAIEKDGRIGLQREPSQDSVLSSTRKVSGETDISTTTPPAKLESSNIFANMGKAPGKTSLQDQAIPESPRTETAGGFAPGPSKTPQNERSDGPASASRKPKVETESTPKQDATTSGSSSKTEPEAANGGPSVKGKEKAREESAKTNTPAASKPAPKPLTVASSSKATAKPAKSPTVSKAPKSPAESSAPKLPAKTPERSVRQPQKVETPVAKASSSAASGSSSVKRPPPLQHTSSPGFVKPKPKSPTRPARLPPSLTTHTAASGSKLNNPRQSTSRASGNLQVVDSLGRSPSRTSVSTTATRTGETRALKRQSSSIGRQRPSLGPPPKQAAKDHPPTKKEREVDESFLARMTRHTQASASRTQEKVTTPPRKATTTATKKPVAKTEAKTARRAAPKTTVAGPSSETQASSSRQAPVESQTATQPTTPVTISANSQSEDPSTEMVTQTTTELEHEETEDTTQPMDTTSDITNEIEVAETDIEYEQVAKPVETSQKDETTGQIDSLTTGTAALQLDGTASDEKQASEGDDLSLDNQVQDNQVKAEGGNSGDNAQVANGTAVAGANAGAAAGETSSGNAQGASGGDEPTSPLT